MGRPLRRPVAGQGATPPGGRRPAAAGATPYRRRRLRAGILLALFVLAGYLGFEAYAPWHAWGTVARVASEPTGDRPISGDGHTYLLVGSDSREDLTPAERKRLGTGSDPGRRTDTIIVVHVPSGDGKSTLISIPRDSYLPIPGHGHNKVNAAFAIGGPVLLVETLEQATGLRIDGYLEIGFGGFSRVVDALGGVDICVKFDMVDPKANINLKKGCQTLSGPQALGFVRSRYTDPRGDIGRAERQRQFLGAIMKKAAQPATVLNPVSWWRTTHAAVAGLIIGEDTSLLDAGRVALTLRGVSSGDTLSLVVPLKDTNATTAAGSSVLWDDAAAGQLFTMLRNGDPLESPPAGTDGKPSG